MLTQRESNTGEHPRATRNYGGRNFASLILGRYRFDFNFDLDFWFLNHCVAGSP
jgi:hypothetical protein